MLSPRLRTFAALTASGFVAGVVFADGILPLFHTPTFPDKSLESNRVASHVTAAPPAPQPSLPNDTSALASPTPALPDQAIDVQATLAQAKGIASVGRRSKFLQDFVRKWVLVDPKKALEFAGSQPSLRLRGELCEAALGTMARTDRKGALQWANDNLQGDSLMKATRGILDTWSQSDPGQACAWLLQQTPSQITESADMVIRRLVEANPNAAMQQLSWLPDGPLRDRLAPRFIAGLSEVDPTAAGTWMTQNTTPDEFGRLATVLTQRWGYNDPEAALNWLADNSSRANLSNSVAAVTSYYAESDVAGALKWAENQTDESVQKNVYSSIATTWAASAPDQAFKWFESIPDPAMRQQLASSFSAGLSLNANPGQLTALMNEPDPTVRDSLLASFANMQVSQNTNDALSAASSVQDPQQRSVVLRQVFAAVSNRAPDQAAAWLASPTVSQADRTLLQSH